MDITIRTANRTDVPAIVALLAEDRLGRRRETPSELEPYLAAFADMAAQGGNIALVAERDIPTGTDVVGCLQLTILPGLSRRGAKRGQIEGVRVSGTCRGLGIGERLIRRAIETAHNAGCSLVQLTSDNSRPDAHRFYARLGFIASHAGFKLALD